MGRGFQKNMIGFWKGARLGRRALCATLSFAVLNASLAPVYAMPESLRSCDHVRETPKKALKAAKENFPKTAGRGAISSIFEEDFQEAPPVPTPAPKAATAPMGYGAWVLKGLESVADLAFSGSKSLVSLFSRGVSYALKNPGEALVAGLTTQITVIHAIRPLTDDFLINQNTTGDQHLKSVAGSVAILNNGNVFVTWQGNQAGTNDIYGRVLSPAGTPLINEFTINQNTTGDQAYSSVAALSSGNAFVTWHGNQAGNYGIYGRIFFPSGTALTNDLLINQNTTGIQLYPSAAALSNGNVLVVWIWYQTGNADIYGRIFFTNGTALTSDLLINQITTGGQYNPSVAALSNGNAFVTWNGNQAGNADVYGRVLAPNGTALAGEFMINQNTTGTQGSPSVEILNNGNVFVTWDGDQTGTWDIYGRVLAPNGTALTREFTINQVTTGDQASPSVAALSNGNAFVTWHGNQAGNDDIYGRVLAPNGAALTNEFAINQVTTGNQFSPSVAVLSNGNAFVTWHGNQTGNYDIYGRVFDLSNPVQQPISPLPALLGVGGAVLLGVSLGGSLLTACAIGGLCGVKQYKSYRKKNPQIKNPPKPLKERVSRATPFAAGSEGFTEHPTFIGTLKDRTYAIWKDLSEGESKRLQLQIAKEVPPFSYNLDKAPFFLGKGSFGATYAGIDFKTGELYAIKEVYGRQAVDESLREVEIQQKLRKSSQIMGLVDYKSYEPGNDNPNSHPRLFQVMPLAYTNGAGYKQALSLLKEENSQAEARLSDTFHQLMKGLSYMHSKGIYHLDIKADNILYMRDGSLRIGDFGRARELGPEGQITDARMGDRRFFSPEQFAFLRHGLKQNGHQAVGQEEALSALPAWAADTWQGGLYILELLTQKDHPLSEAAAPYETKLNGWTNATFETALKGI